MDLKGALLTTATAAAFLVGAGAADAQQLHIGPHASYGTEDFSELGVGAHATYLVTQDIAGAASFTYHFPGEGITFWDLNINGHYRFPIDASLTPYVGAGINYSNISFDFDDFFGVGSASASEVGLNVLGGGFLDMNNGMRLFGEGRFVISDADQLVLTVGLSIPIGN